jgi:hypothetical protein
MPQYQFVFKETPIGKAKHDTHLDRREEAKAKGAVLDVRLAHPVVETLIGGDWYYTWVVDTPDVQTVSAFIQECVRHPNVELSSGPTPVFTAEELSQIQSLSAKMRGAYPDK